jgi:hypothetical protein
MKTNTPARREIQRPKLMLGQTGWLKGRGKLVYDPWRTNKNDSEDWLVLEVDREITRLFRWFIDRELINLLGVEGQGVLQPSWDAHISILRGRNDLRYVPREHKAALWNKYQHREVEFLYSPHVKVAKGEFFFVEVHCPWLLDIRAEEFNLPYDFGLHLTVAKFRDHWVGQYDPRLRSARWYGK